MAAKQGEGRGRIDLNEATDEELRSLEGIDVARSRLILEHRRTHGPFRSWEDVRAVAGIDTVLLGKLQEATTLGGAEARQVRPSGRREEERAGSRGERGVPPAREAPAGGGRIDLNTATSDELTMIEGIDGERARAILEFRQKHGRFQSWDELHDVPGFDGVLVGKVKQAASLGQAQGGPGVEAEAVTEGEPEESARMYRGEHPPGP